MISPVSTPSHPPARLYDRFRRPLPPRAVAATAPPPDGGMRPFTPDELEWAWEAWCAQSPVLADALLVLARTGLRWAELRALRVGDVDADVESALVARSAPEPEPAGPLSPDRVRRVPLAPRIRGAVAREVAGRDADELLFTTALGEQLNRTPVLSRVRWSQTARGRRLTDLRHTAASLWLAEGVDAATVRHWLGERRLAA
ncbi:site-specific integrase [Micropruina sonneratiae]|uniref:site-specific integrase n=1 Tax=Micropruina sonneratiae TaxID=2986940 RepID=UPI002227BD63|nr:site-specific integrase [Micropruina sp. KQZ13P-5]MCW3157259.1 site-specific integrase [Micropruina sp. KQZ13P-5]